MKGKLPKGLEEHHAKNHEAGRGQLGPKLLSLTELSVTMPPVDAPEGDLLHWAEKFSSLNIEFRLDGCNERGLRAEDDIYTPWEKLGGEEEQLNFARKAHELMSRIGLAFLSGHDPKEGEYYGVKWLASGQEDLAILLGYYSSLGTQSRNGNDRIINGYVKLSKSVLMLGSTDGSGSKLGVRMFKGPSEVHAYHHTLRPGDEFSNKLTQNAATYGGTLSAPLGYKLEEEDLETREGHIEKWGIMKALADSSERAQQLNEEINRIAELFAEGKEAVQITPVKHDHETGLLKMLSSNRALIRLNEWLDKSYPTGETAKKPAKKASASKKRKSKEPATKSEAPKKKRAKKAAVSKPAVSKPAAEPDPEKVAKLEKAKKAKLDAAIASAERSSDGEVGAKELAEAAAAGYSKFFVLGRAKEERS